MISLSSVEKGGNDTVFSMLYPVADRPLREEPVRIRGVFHISGDLGRPDFSGIRVYRYYKKYGYVLVEIAVPDEYVIGENAFNRNPDFLLRCKSFIVDSVRESVRLATELFAKKCIPFNEKAATACVDRIEREMTVEKMQEAVASRRVKPPSPDLLKRVKSASAKKKGK